MRLESARLGAWTFQYSSLWGSRTDTPTKSHGPIKELEVKLQKGFYEPSSFRAGVLVDMHACHPEPENVDQKFGQPGRRTLLAGVP